MGFTTQQTINYFAVGIIGNIIFYSFYQFFIYILPDPAAYTTLAWVLSYLISIFWQHLLFRYYVFGIQTPYLKSLIWTYLSYTISIVLSAVLNYVLIYYASLNESLVWFITFVISSFINYFLVRYITQLIAVQCKIKEPHHKYINQPDYIDHHHTPRLNFNINHNHNI